MESYSRYLNKEEEEIQNTDNKAKVKIKKYRKTHLNNSSDNDLN